MDLFVSPLRCRSSQPSAKAAVALVILMETLASPARAPSLRGPISYETARLSQGPTEQRYAWRNISFCGLFPIYQWLILACFRPELSEPILFK